MEPEQLRRWIDENGRTVKGLAVELDVNRATVQRWLSGSTPIPRTVELALQALEGSETK